MIHVLHLTRAPSRARCARNDKLMHGRSAELATSCRREIARSCTVERLKKRCRHAETTSKPATGRNSRQRCGPASVPARTGDQAGAGVRARLRHERRGVHWGARPRRQAAACGKHRLRRCQAECDSGRGPGVAGVQRHSRLYGILGHQPHLQRGPQQPPVRDPPGDHRAELAGEPVLVRLAEERTTQARRVAVRSWEGAAGSGKTYHSGPCLEDTVQWRH